MGGGGKSTGAKLVVCLGEEEPLLLRNKERFSIPCIKVSWKCYNQVNIKKEETMIC